ncbi:MAG TPA: hypothetical protein VJ044_15335, partial [Candidatus Hodarchaeales archaeon]|nr:hypothetical protein [Candidatus Hodarchaeales archaeon]
MARSTQSLPNILSFGVRAMETCEAIHNRTGSTRIPLVDVASEISRGTKKKDIQMGLWLLVALGFLEDDGDEDFVNYDAGLNAVIGELARVDKYYFLPLFMGSAKADYLTELGRIALFE